jgi:hypothetical protein
MAEIAASPIVAHPSAQLTHWHDMWREGKTGWRVAERQSTSTPSGPSPTSAQGTLADLLEPFERAVQMTQAALGLDESVALQYPGPGDTVLVPLCGDTPALRYFFNRGCKVVGVDIVGTALESAAAEMFAADCDIEKRAIRRDVASPVAALDAPVYAGGCHTEAPDFAITAKPKAGSTTAPPTAELLLLACSFMDIPEAEVPSGSCAFVWDRASMVAMEPTVLRPQYIAALKRLWLGAAQPATIAAAAADAKVADSSVEGHATAAAGAQPVAKGITGGRHNAAATCMPLIFLNVVERPFGPTQRTDGTPFHIAISDLATRWYPAPHFDIRAVHRYTGGAKAPFQDCLYAVQPTAACEPTK